MRCKMAEIMSASAGIVGTLPAVGTCIGKIIASLTSFNYQLVTSIFKGISDCSRVIVVVFGSLVTVFGEIFHYVADVVAECGNVVYSFLRLGSKFMYLIYYMISLGMCGVVCTGEAITTFIASCLRVVLLLLGKIGSSVASTWHYVKTTIAEVAPGYMDNVTSSINKFTIIVSNSLQYGAKYMAVTVGAILSAVYESLSISVRNFWQLLTEWFIYIIKTATHCTTTGMLYVKYGLEFVALTFQRHVNVDCYMFAFLATTMFISVKVILDYMNKKDLTLPLPGFRRQTRISLRNGHNVSAYTIDSSDEEIFGNEEYNELLEESDDVSVTTSEDDSDSITHEEYEIGSEDSDESLESEGGRSVQIQLPPPGGYNLRTREKSSNPPSSAGASLDIYDEEELNRKCVVCQDQPKTVLVLPCKHMCLCVDCAHTIASLRNRVRRVCPLCRGHIHTVMNVYL